MNKQNCFLLFKSVIFFPVTEYSQFKFMGLCRGGHLPAKQLILKFLLPNHSVIYIWKHLRLFFPPALLLYSCSVLNFILIFWCKALRPTSSPRYTFSALLLQLSALLLLYQTQFFKLHTLIFQSTASPPYNYSPSYTLYAVLLLQPTTLHPFTPLLDSVLNSILLFFGLKLLRPSTFPP